MRGSRRCERTPVSSGQQQFVNPNQVLIMIGRSSLPMWLECAHGARTICKSGSAKRQRGGEFTMSPTSETFENWANEMMKADPEAAIKAFGASTARRKDQQLSNRYRLSSTA